MATGVDLVDLGEIRCALSTFGSRYIDRLFSGEEQQAWASSMPEFPLTYCALGFAVKEAVFKVLDAPDEGLDWRDIRVSFNGPSIQALNLHGRVADWASSAGLSNWRVSGSLAGGKAVAMVCASRLKQG
ncbi:MAG: Holo-[acyl-carrier-protein] synthase [Pseudomonadota bacterium]